jgi:hypothetical protein
MSTARPRRASPSGSDEDLLVATTAPAAPEVEMKRPRRPLTIACTVLSLAFMAGCGSENTSSQSSPSRMPTSALGATGKPKESTAPAPREESKSSLQTVQAFADFATGKANRVPWSTETTLYFNGAEVARFDPARAGRRDSWSGCPHGSATFEGRDCPVLPLTVVRDANRDRGRSPSRRRMQPGPEVGRRRGQGSWLDPSGPGPRLLRRLCGGRVPRRCRGRQRGERRTEWPLIPAS